MVSFVGNAFASKIQQKTYNAVTSHDTKALDKLRRVLCVVGTGMKSSKNKSKPKLELNRSPSGVGQNQMNWKENEMMCELNYLQTGNGSKSSANTPSVVLSDQHNYLIERYVHTRSSHTHTHTQTHLNPL